MKITNLRVKNFKSFADLNLDLGDLNYLVGANASGKSNFISIFNFLRNLSRHGLENAVSMEGGMEYLRNAAAESDEAIEFSISYTLPDPNPSSTIGRKNKRIEMQLTSIDYAFAIRNDANEIQVIKDDLHVEFQLFTTIRKNSEWGEPEVSGRAFGIINLDKSGKMNTNIKTEPEIDDFEADAFFRRFEDWNFDGSMPLINTPIFKIIHSLKDPFGKMAIFDIDPKQPKRAASITGMKDLDEQATNLSIVLKRLLENEDQKRKFLNLVRDILPFIDNFEVQRFADKSILFTLHEVYDGNEVSLPATFVSDGTINLVAIIIALFFENKGPLLFEEPERNIHPHLMAKLVDMFEEAAKDKQIIITTHNPEIVRHANTNDLFLISRDEKGFSYIDKPIRQEAVRIFLEKDRYPCS